MTDFYSVLQRAVSSLPDGSGPNRRAVYDKARKALLKQLQSFDPPLPSSDVTAQRLALEDAIRKIENEIARQIRTQRALQTAMPANKGVVRRPSGDAASDAAASALAARAAEAERAAQRAAEAERARRQHAEMLENAVSEATIESPRALRSTAPVPVTAQPVRDFDPAPDDDGMMFEEDAHFDDDAHDVEDPRADIVDGEYDEVGDDDDLDVAYGTAPAVEPRAARANRKDERRARKEEERRLKAERRSSRKADRKQADKRNARKAAATAPAGEKRKRGVGLGRAVLPIILLALLAGAAYAAYTQREALMAVLEDLQQDPAKRPPITVTSREGVAKNVDRLPTTLDGEDTRTVTTTTWPAGDGTEAADGEGEMLDGEVDAGDETGGEGDEGGDEGAALDPPDRSVGGEISPFAPDSGATAAEERASALDTGSSAQTETEVASVDPNTTAPTTPTTPVQDFTASGTQQAVLYEESSVAGEQGTAVAGGVEWSMVRESISGGDPEPVIRATAEIPERNMTATITVRENLDGALPASHLIEIAFEVPEGFEGGGVKNVPGVIMKQNEEARGEALRGAAARVSSGLFWIALSESDVDKDSNLRLLRERDWIDIPILYESGRRAILTLRKGSDGSKSINSAIQAWNAG